MGFVECDVLSRQGSSGCDWGSQRGNVNFQEMCRSSELHGQRCGARGEVAEPGAWKERGRWERNRNSKTGARSELSNTSKRRRSRTKFRERKRRIWRRVCSLMCRHPWHIPLQDQWK